MSSAITNDGRQATASGARGAGKPYFARGLAAGVALLLLGVLAACSTDFDPYAEGPPFFALDAILDGRADTQFVRVQDLRVAPGAPPAPLAATVTLTDLATAGVATLRDSLVVLDDGATGHLFWTTTPLLAGRTYALRATRDGDPEATSSATLSFPNAVITPEAEADTLTARRLAFSGQPAMGSFLDVVYSVRRTDTGQVATVTSRYSPETTSRGSRIQVFLTADSRDIRNALGIVESEPFEPPYSVAVTDVEVRWLAVSPAPASVMDGRGQIAWRLPLSDTWVVPPEALARVGLADEQAGDL